MINELMSLRPITVFSSSLLGCDEILIPVKWTTFICCFELTLAVSPQTGKDYRHNILCIYYYFTKFYYIFWDSNKKSQIHFCIFNHYSCKVIKHTVTTSVANYNTLPVDANVINSDLMVPGCYQTH